MSTYKTEVKMIDGDLFIVIPENFVEPLKRQVNSIVDIEIVGNTLQMSKV